MTSATTPARPPIIAPRPMRTNWCTAGEAAEDHVVLDRRRGPPRVALLAMITWLPMRQSCATCVAIMKRLSSPTRGDAAAALGAGVHRDVLADACCARR